ncbi:hypothetical protein AAVH_38298, partial [Aphelenchoides avenae]
LSYTTSVPWIIAVVTVGYNYCMVMWCSVRIWARVKHARNMSLATREVNEQLNCVLVVQASCPILFMVLPITGMFLTIYTQQEAADYLKLMTTAVSWVPVLNPLSSIYFVKCYRSKARVKPNNEHLCPCKACLNKENQSAHLVSDWLIRKKGLTKLKGWKPEHECSTTSSTPQWCEEGRPLRAEDLRQFFEENFQRVYRAPRGDCLTYCRGFRKFSGEHVTHVYYGTQNHCEIGVGIGICVGASYYEYYVDKDQHLHLVADTFDKAACVFFAALRSSVVFDEVRVSQVALSPTFTDLLKDVGPTVRIIGALS